MPSETAAGPPEEATFAEGRKNTPEIREEWLDPDAVKVVRRLRRADFTAYLVGGCVRDLLLGMHPKDFDVATSAHPNQVKTTFRNSRLIGRRFRLAHVYYKGGKVIEVSTFRANPLDELTDLPQDLLIRHDNVFGDEEEDARRRDFTINGLFYEVDEGRVVDHVGGKADLRARLVRTIGDPDVRMREDPVRILRAIRFAAKCGLSVEARTYAAMKTHVAEIPRCAPPRVLEAVLKLLRSGPPRCSRERCAPRSPTTSGSRATASPTSPSEERARLLGPCPRASSRPRSCSRRWYGRRGCRGGSRSGPGSSSPPSPSSPESARSAASPPRRSRGRASSRRPSPSSSCRWRRRGRARSSSPGGRQCSPRRTSPRSSRRARRSPPAPAAEAAGGTGRTNAGAAADAGASHRAREGYCCGAGAAPPGAGGVAPGAGGVPSGAAPGAVSPAGAWLAIFSVIIPIVHPAELSRMRSRPLMARSYFALSSASKKMTGGPCVASLAFAAR